MADFFSNPWTVGIGGGILSGVVVAWISKKLFSQKENKEHTQKISSANQEVLYSLRPLIPESAFPSISILESVIAATCRKYKINRKDMASTVDFFNELIKEVMDSSFIQHDKKIEYSLHLTALKNESEQKESSKIKTLENTATHLMYQERYSGVLSMSLGLMVALTTILLTISEFKSNTHVNSDLLNIILPVGAALIVSLFGLTATSTQVKKSRLFQKIQSFLPW